MSFLSEAVRVLASGGRERSLVLRGTAGGGIGEAEAGKAGDGSAGAEGVLRQLQAVLAEEMALSLAMLRQEEEKGAAAAAGSANVSSTAEKLSFEVAAAPSLARVFVHARARTIARDVYIFSSGDFRVRWSFDLRFSGAQQCGSMPCHVCFYWRLVSRRRRGGDTFATERPMEVGAAFSTLQNRYGACGHAWMPFTSIVKNHTYQCASKRSTRTLCG